VVRKFSTTKQNPFQGDKQCPLPGDGGYEGGYEGVYEVMPFTGDEAVNSALSRVLQGPQNAYHQPLPFPSSLPVCNIAVKSSSIHFVFF
jgi:hypothetical protein